MIDEIIKDWYDEEKKPRKAAAKTEKPKSAVNDLVQRIAQQYVEAIEKIKEAGDATAKTPLPRQSDTTTVFPILESDSQNDGRLPYYPRTGATKPETLPYYPQAGLPRIEPLPYSPKTNDPRFILLSNAANTVPSPEPGPPPTSDPTPSYTPTSVQQNKNSQYIMVDPAVLAAQEDYKQWLSRGSADPALMQAQQDYKNNWLAELKRQNEATVFVDPGLADAQKEYEKMLSRGFVDPTLAEAQKDDQKRSTNPFRLNPEHLVLLAISQVGYTEKDDAQYNNDDVTDATHRGLGNYTKYGLFTGNDGLAWCASFISWLINQDNQHSSFAKSASTGYIMDEYGDDYRKNDHLTPPYAGDLVIFYAPGKPVTDEEGNYIYNSDGSKKLGYYHCHIGIVVAFDPKTGTVYTVEGNTSGIEGCDGCVNYHSHNIYDVYNKDMDKETNKLYIQGFCSNGGSSYGTITDEMKQAKPTVTIQ